MDPMTSAVIKESIGSAETIQLCAQHQKSIVDERVSKPEAAITF
jgi:hypothetical protein